jgi:beta-glucosidase
MILKTVLIILGTLALVVASIIAIGLSNPKYPLNPSDYKWAQMDDFNPGATADSLLQEMTLEEKVDQLRGGGLSTAMRMGVRFVLFKHSKPFPIFYSGMNKRLGIPPIAFSDGPRGVTVSSSTGFPVAMARGASWDADLERRVADVMGKELRASNSNFFGGLCINLLRHPGWGRAQETYGEDPFLLGEMGMALMEGVQQHQVMACAKHFAANSIENARFYVDVQMDDRTMHEVYLPHFKKVVDSGVASIMSAYNRVNGTYCGENAELLTGILRDQWGFEGFVISDFVWGIHEAEGGLKAGMDIEMPVTKFYTTKQITKLIDEGSLSMDLVNDRVRRVVKRKLEYISTPDLMDYSTVEIAGPAHASLALEAAEKSMVLLKNDENVLPLNKKSIKKLVVVGSLASEINTGDHGSSYVKPPYVVTHLEGIQNALGQDVDVQHYDDSNVQAAMSAVEDADAVIIVAGYRYNDEGEYVINDPSKEGARAKEGGDRESLRLKPEDQKMILEMSEAHPRCIVALVGGSAIVMEQWKESVPSILMTWYAGMEGGTALANILFGDVNPSGKLPFTIPKDEKQLPLFEPFTKQVLYEYYHGYTLFDKEQLEPAYPFGFGLSYTEFTYKNMNIIDPELSGEEVLKAEIEVSNSGSRTGEEVVQLYVGFKNSRVDRPVKLLRGFHKVELHPGETAQVKFEFPMEDLAWYNPETGQWEIEEMEYELYLGSSSAEADLSSTTFTYTNAKALTGIQE